MALRAQVEPHIEVHKFHTFAVAGSTFFALLLQVLLQKYFQRASYLELPFLVTLYFGLSRRNPSTGLLLGMTIGLLQDGLSNIQLGMNGIAKTLVGFGASSLGARIDTEHPLARAILTVLFYWGHQCIFVLTKRLLLNEPETLFTVATLVTSLVSSALAVALFPLLDRLRKPS